MSNTDNMNWYQRLNDFDFLNKNENANKAIIDTLQKQVQTFSLFGETRQCNDQNGYFFRKIF